MVDIAVGEIEVHRLAIEERLADEPEDAVAGIIDDASRSIEGEKGEKPHTSRRTGRDEEVAGHQAEGEEHDQGYGCLGDGTGEVGLAENPRHGAFAEERLEKVHNTELFAPQEEAEEDHRQGYAAKIPPGGAGVGDGNLMTMPHGQLVMGKEALARDGLGMVDGDEERVVETMHFCREHQCSAVGQRTVGRDGIVGRHGGIEN